MTSSLRGFSGLRPTGDTGRRLILTGGLVALSLGVFPGGGRPCEAAGLDTRRALVHLRAVGRGAFVDGPQHSLHAIQRSPIRYGAMLVSIAVAGAGARYFGLNPAPLAIGLSTLATGWSAWRALPLIRATSSVERSNVIGREILWPVALSAGTTAAGHYGMGPPEANHAVNAKLLAKTGLQSAVIGFDVPTIVQTVLDTERPVHPAGGRGEP